MGLCRLRDPEERLDLARRQAFELQKRRSGGRLGGLPTCPQPCATTAFSPAKQRVGNNWTGVHSGWSARPEKGLPLSVATHWSGAGFQPHQIVCLYHLFGDDVETARTWKDLSIGPLSNNSITEVVKAGLSRDEVDRWMAVGAGLGDIPQALRRGLTMEQVAAWLRAGFLFSQAAPVLSGRNTRWRAGVARC